MIGNRPSSVVQGYFPSGVPSGLVQPARVSVSSRQAGTAGAGVHRPPTYQELTAQAHQRTAGDAVQPAAANRTVLVLPPHAVCWGRRRGQELPPAVQQKMSSFFKTDFSDVQIHVGPEASTIGALAFTQGSSIFFAPGQYNPGFDRGQQLLAHELTHVVQQRAGRVRNPFGSGVAIVQDPALEAEAERMSTQATSHRPLAWVNPVLQQRTAAPGDAERKSILARMARRSPPWVMHAWSPVLQRSSAEVEEASASDEEEEEQPRRSVRKRKEVPRKRGSAQFILDGFNDFDAIEADEGDGKNVTYVRLKIGRKFYPGATGLNHGHAEMDALYDFCKEHGDAATAVEAFSEIDVKTVACTKKPCCVKCSAIMGHLGFKPTSGTHKTYHTMGGTEWAVDPLVRTFIATYTGVPEDTIIGMGSVSQPNLLTRKKQKAQPEEEDDDD